MKTLERSLDFYCGVLGVLEGERGRRGEENAARSHLARQRPLARPDPSFSSILSPFPPLCPGLTLNPARPDAKLPYRGAWLMVGPDMIHLMELPSPDPTDGRPEHGGKDRHACVGVADAAALGARLEAAGVAYTKSASGRAAIFFRDPDGNVLECAEHGEWR